MLTGWASGTLTGWASATLAGTFLPSGVPAELENPAVGLKLMRRKSHGKGDAMMSFKTAIGSMILAAATLTVGQAFAEPTIDQVYKAAEAGNFSQAQQMMDEVLRAHPNSAKAHYVEAELLARQGRVAAARDELRTAERLEPGLPFARAQAVQDLQRRLGGQGGLV